MTQRVSSLASEARFIPVNLIIHGTSEGKCLELAKEHARCNSDQIEHISGMTRGETIVFLENDHFPCNVQIVPLSELVETPVRTGFWTADQVREAMQPVYKKHPELKASLPLPDKLVEVIEGTASPLDIARNGVQGQAGVDIVRPSNSSEVELRLDRIVCRALKSESIGSLYHERLQQAEQCDTRLFVDFICQFCWTFCPKDVSLSLFVKRFVLVFSGYPPRPKGPSSDC